MRRGDVCLVDLEPVRGSEANKRRPAVIVSNNRANAAVGRSPHAMVTIVPLTSNVSRVYPFQVLVSAGSAGLHHDSKVQAEQVRSVAVDRLGPTLGRLSPPLLLSVDAALRLHLGL